MNILWHNGNSLGVDSAQVGVLKKPDEVGLRRLLQSQDGGRLESKIGLEILRDLSNEALEGRLSDQKVS